MSRTSHHYPTCYIISAYRGGETEQENELMSLALEHELRDSPYADSVKEVEGVYKGAREASFVVTCPEPYAARIARAYGQTCYLRLEQHKHGVRKATFVYTGYVGGCGEEPAGYFRQVPNTVIDALSLDYTYCPSQDLYYTIWPSDTTMMEDWAREVTGAIAKKEQLA